MVGDVGDCGEVVVVVVVVVGFLFGGDGCLAEDYVEGLCGCKVWN